VFVFERAREGKELEVEGLDALTGLYRGRWWWWSRGLYAKLTTAKSTRSTNLKSYMYCVWPLLWLNRGRALPCRGTLTSYSIPTEFSSDTCPTVPSLSDRMSLFFCHSVYQIDNNPRIYALPP
jgi:hypothetical protein